MSLPRRQILFIFGICLLSGAFVGLFLGGAGASQSAAWDSPNQEADSSVHQASLAATIAPNETPAINRTVFSLDLQPNTDGHWEISMTFDLEDDAERAAFETLGTEFEDGEAAPLGFPAFEAAIERVDAGTDREMQIVDVDREWSISSEGDSGADEERAVGQLRLTFVWEQFARSDGQELLVDETVLLADDELWLRGLSADQTLVVDPPSGYGIEDASVPPTEGQLIWRGPVTFDVESLQITFGGDERNNDDTGTVAPPGDDGESVVPLVLVLISAMLVVVAVVLTAQSRQVRTRISAIIASSGESDDQGASAGSADSGSEATGSTTTSQAGAGEVGADPDADADAPADELDDGVDLELLSDEERVEYLLESNGGRMKQASIVKETDWSNAKVSQLLSTMEESGRINKLRIGRENLISFPDEDIGEFDDE